MRVVATHQDPWRKQGSGMMWASQLVPTQDFFNNLKSTFGFAG
jgi:hypothetical protein